FFSSRRRHTRFSRDWSSDVCSSDLQECPPGQTGLPVSATRRETRPLRPGLAFRKAGRSARTIEEIDAAPCFNSRSPPALKHGRQIGRASCRERGESAGGDGIRKRKE